LEGGTVMHRAILVVAIVLGMSALSVIAPARAQTDETRQSCMNDALRLCQEAIPDRERVFNCLATHKDALSPACHAVMAARAPGSPPPKEQVSETKMPTPHAKKSRVKKHLVQGRKRPPEAGKQRSNAGKANTKSLPGNSPSKNAPKQPAQPLAPAPR
jgi:hypothetical protein